MLQNLYLNYQIIPNKNNETWKRDGQSYEFGNITKGFVSKLFGSSNKEQGKGGGPSK
jgi:hypothetical protein